MVLSAKDLVEEVLNIRTIELTKTAANIIERIIWILIAIAGTIWFISFMVSQVTLWNNHKTVVSKAELKLSDIDYPSVSVCSKSANKYGIVEKLGNNLNPNANLDVEFLAWWKEKALQCSMTNHIKTTRIQNGDMLYNKFCHSQQGDKSYFPCQVSISDKVFKICNQ